MTGHGDGGAERAEPSPRAPHPALLGLHTEPAEIHHRGRQRGIQLAGVAGYADQAHLTREWRAMSGYSPGEWQRVEVPFLQDVAPAGGNDGRQD